MSKNLVTLSFIGAFPPRYRNGMITHANIDAVGTQRNHIREHLVKIHFAAAFIEKHINICKKHRQQRTIYMHPQLKRFDFSWIFFQHNSRNRSFFFVFQKRMIDWYSCNILYFFKFPYNRFQNFLQRYLEQHKPCCHHQH